MASTAVNGQCGTSNGKSVTTPPTTGLCNTGTASAVTGGSGTDVWQWSCAGTGGGTNASCVTASGSTAGGSWWKAAPGSEWQWEIDHALDTSSASDMGTGKTAYNGDTAPATNPVIYDIDGFDNDASTVSTLHSMGMKVTCYIEVGSAENYRSDYSEFPAASLGNTMPGYSAEKYVDIRNATVISIIEARIQMCASKGFDAIEPDIDESYGSNTGFPLTKAIEETYMTTLTNYAHSLGVAMWGKNPDDTGDSYAADMVNVFDGILTEQCNEYGTCDLLNAYATAGKAVFNAEYNLSTSSFCPADNSRSNFNGVLFNVNLNGSRSPCR